MTTTTIRPEHRHSPLVVGSSERAPLVYLDSGQELLTLHVDEARRLAIALIEHAAAAERPSEGTWP